MFKRFFCLIAVALLISCTWVKLEKPAESVEVLRPDQIERCERLRRTTSKVAHKLGIIKRNPEKMATELATLARNTAVELGGNAIVPDTDIEDGQQSFIIYRCPEFENPEQVDSNVEQSLTMLHSLGLQ